MSDGNIIPEDISFRLEKDVSLVCIFSEKENGTHFEKIQQEISVYLSEG